MSDARGAGRSPTTDPFEHADAAYVMGALDPHEAADFEAHLRGCPACQERVEQARSTVALLAGASAADVNGADAAAPVPDTLLPGLLRRARREQHRRSFVLAGVAAVAAACLVILAAVLLWPSSNTAPAPDRQAFVAVRPSPVTASAQLVSKPWGTEIDLQCKYTQTIYAAHPYLLRVIDRDNRRHPAGSWSLVPGKAVTFTGGTSVPRARIARVEITSTDGTAILQLTG